MQGCSQLRKRLDNWLISPEVTLDGTLSLWAAPYSINYHDNFGVYVLAGPFDADNFDANAWVKVGDDYCVYEWAKLVMIECRRWFLLRHSIVITYWVSSCFFAFFALFPNHPKSFLVVRKDFVTPSQGPPPQPEVEGCNRAYSALVH